MIDNGVVKTSLHHALTSESSTDLIRSVDAFLFDCHGVIWKGEKLIDGVPEALQALRSMVKKLIFVTNNSTKSRRQYARKFCALGLDLDEGPVPLTFYKFFSPLAKVKDEVPSGAIEMDTQSQRSKEASFINMTAGANEESNHRGEADERQPLLPT